MSASPQPQYQCPTCQSASVQSRNLAVFIDGTSNKPGPKKTNVFKLFEAISDGDGQHKLYLKGIGAYEDDELPLSSYVGKAIYGGFEMGLAWNVGKNVKCAYGWLADTYQAGDRIYLFGFSRGAYQVRALAGIIHEVGLVKEKCQERIDQAYRRYLSIDPHNPKTNESAVEFKKAFCRPDVRIHFMGVWDTVSSLGLIKQDVHITASASVTNACHFRHALAFDERRVKFMPEYFLEMNAHRSKRSPRSAVGDVKEVWFAGCHGDVGGISRSYAEVVPDPLQDVINPVHAGNVPLLWMRGEAVDNGLVFKPEEFPWWPEDVDLGRGDSMNWFWRIFEIVWVRQQVSFSGTGKHKRRQHWFHPRLVIPGQEIHPSVFPGDAYTPYATLASGIEIPIVPQKDSDGLWPTEPWTTELVDEATTTRLLTLLLSDQQKALQSLGEVLLLLNLRLSKGHTGTIRAPEWSFREQTPFDLDRFALTVIYDVISNCSTSEELVRGARDFLCAILPSQDCLDFPRVFYILRFSARHPALRRRFISHDKVVDALMRALDQVGDTDVFPLVMNSLCYLIDDEHYRSNVIDQIFANGTRVGKTRLLLALDARAPFHLVASLKVIASVAQHQPGRCEGLRSEIIKLVTKEGPVGSAALEALVKLEKLERGPYNIHFSNVLGYLANTLPRLDAEIGSASSPREIADLPSVLKVNGSGELDEKVMRKLVSTMRSQNTHQRTAATLTLLKLCNNTNVRKFCSQNTVLDTFVEQLKRKRTSLLAAYALKTCLRYDDVWSTNHFPRVAQLIVDMINKGWFDDAVGRVEGKEIFRELVKSAKLQQKVADSRIVATLQKKLEAGNRHEIRMSLICLDILWKENVEDLKRTVTNSVALLKDKDMKNRMRGVKTLSSLAQMEAGEEAIKPHVSEIIKMLHPSDGVPPPRNQLFAASAALFDLCKNASLSEQIQQSEEYKTFKARRRNSTLYPQTRSGN